MNEKLIEELMNVSEDAETNLAIIKVLDKHVKEEHEKKKEQEEAEKTPSNGERIATEQNEQERKTREQIRDMNLWN